MLCREIIAVCSEIHTNTLCGQNVELYIKIQSVPRSKYSASVIQPSQLVLCREIIAVCSKIHTKRINTFYGQNVELYIKIQSVPRSKYSASVIQPSQVFFCIFIYLSFKYKWLAWMILLVVFYGGTLLFSLESPIIELIKYKIDSGSAEYSTNTLMFAFTPRTIIGTNFFDLSYLNINDGYDVGFIIFILNIVFLIIFIYRIVYLNFSKNNSMKMISLFALYFLLHSTKLALRNYSLSFLPFVMFIVTKCYYEIKTRKTNDVLENSFICTSNSIK